MGLGNTQAMSGMINVHHLAWILNVDDKTIYRWIKKYDFPIHKKNLRTIGKRPFNFVDIDEFWKWAEKHQENINWFKVEPMVLLPEPEWVKLRRKEDFYKKSTRKNWSKKEDQ
jgi:predicted DNA-binding transcriptional regulator AlpA